MKRSHIFYLTLIKFSSSLVHFFTSNFYRFFFSPEISNKQFQKVDWPDIFRMVVEYLHCRVRRYVVWSNKNFSSWFSWTKSRFPKLELVKSLRFQQNFYFNRKIERMLNAKSICNESMKIKFEIRYELVRIKTRQSQFVYLLRIP